MQENIEKSTTKPVKKANKLTNARIKKEIETLQKMFDLVEDPDKKQMIFSLIDEAAFLKVACFQAKEDMKKDGLTTETQNGRQRFTKANPAAAIYDKYAKQYTSIINVLIEYIPPKEKKTVSRLAALRNEE